MIARVLGHFKASLIPYYHKEEKNRKDILACVSNRNTCKKNRINIGLCCLWKNSSSDLCCILLFQPEMYKI